jgi:hypothetical protein
MTRVLLAICPRGKIITVMVPTAPYSSGSNGTTEQSIGATMGLVHIMLNNAKVSVRWWAEAWAYSKMVENLLPSALIQKSSQKRNSQERSKMLDIYMSGVALHLSTSQVKRMEENWETVDRKDD